MRVNLPVSQREHAFPDGEMLVSITDAQGRITHANRAFVDTSGYSYEELMGEPHNLIRHPDMPADAFKDMWSTIGRGRPWSGIVKNRRKNGDHYWVKANATPIMEEGKPVAYMSVRFKPTRAEVQSAEALYAQMAEETRTGRHTFKIHAGRVRLLGWRDLPGKLHRLTLTQRLGIALALMVTLGMLPSWLNLQGAMHWVAHLVLWGLLASLVVWWFHTKLMRSILLAEGLARDLAACNLSRPVELTPNMPMEAVLRPMMQIHTNLRAVLGDVREEIDSFVQSTDAIAKGANDLATRTEAQAGSLERTASAMEQLSSTVRQTAESSTEMSHTSAQSTEVVDRSGKAVGAVNATMQALEDSSHKIADISGVIEGIAFQTNILALNAAVEAARAGEQGRGFAVVASEVRALAQRSATAAKEIKTLITASTELVDASSRQMATAASTIGEVIRTVGRTAELTQAITLATREQAIGIGQVNEAVSHLDSVTQQNAALVDSTSVSVQHLSQRSSVLEKSVGIFYLGRGER